MAPIATLERHLMIQSIAGSQCTCLHKRPGFRMMEVHELYFGFMIPFWTNALETPNKLFTKIFGFIKNKFTAEVEQQKRVDQIKSGIKSGYDKLIEMTELNLLRGLVSFLIL